jgi:hypothetical protein
MASLSISRTYNTGVVLTEADLDAICDGTETFLNTTKINDDNIQNGGITGSSKLIDSTVTAVKLSSDAVTTVKILDSNVTTAKINDLAVTTAKINDLGVTTAKINDLAVTAGKIAADAVTTAKILDSNITTAKIAAANVTRAKLESVGQQISSSSGNYNYASGGLGDVTNLSVAITTSGRPVMLILQSDGSGNVSNISNTTMDGYLQYKRDTTTIATFAVGSYGSSGSNKSFFHATHVDTPAAGTYTYKVQANAGASSTYVTYVKLVAFEL